MNVTITASSTHSIEDIEAFATAEGWQPDRDKSAVQFVSEIVQKTLVDRISVHAINRIVTMGQESLAVDIENKKKEIAASVIINSV